MTQYEWLQLGIQKGWCSESFCSTHDGGPLTEEEVDEFDQGGDPCVHHVRLYEVADE